MKKTYSIIVLLITFGLTACSKENTNEETTKEQLLIDNSPWVFDHYELKEINQGENLGKEFLENNTNKVFINFKLNFYQEGLGSAVSPNNDIASMTWQLSNNTLIITDTSDISDRSYLKNVTVTKSQLTYEHNTETLNENFETIAAHSGVFYFK